MFHNYRYGIFKVGENEFRHCEECNDEAIHFVYRLLRHFVPRNDGRKHISCNGAESLFFALIFFEHLFSADSKFLNIVFNFLQRLQNLPAQRFYFLCWLNFVWHHNCFKTGCGGTANTVQTVFYGVTFLRF